MFKNVLKYPANERLSWSSLAFEDLIATFFLNYQYNNYNMDSRHSTN